MTDLTKIEKPYLLCTKEEQRGLTALIGIEGALQCMDSFSGAWVTTPSRYLAFAKGCTYRQNPDWQPHKLDVPDWFWDNAEFNFVAMGENRKVWAYKGKPEKCSKGWSLMESGFFRLDKLFARHNFNPHNIPWQQSLTVRPGLENDA